MYELLIEQLRTCSCTSTCETCPYGYEHCEDNLIKNAADAIEELEKSIPCWIPVSERLPQDEETVLTWGNQETILLDWRHDNKWCCFGDVTHWMPLPEPPKEE